MNRVTGIPTLAGGCSNIGNFWSHVGAVNEEARAITKGSTGWGDYVTYTVELQYETDHVQVWVDGVQEFDRYGSFPVGNFGFYTNSQANDRFKLLGPLGDGSVCGLDPDADVDGDGVDSGDDPEPWNPLICGDWDFDGIDDCADADGDGFLPPADCNDLDATIYPGAPELCDTIDSDCDGDLVDGYADFDGDLIADCIDTDDDNDGSPDTADCDDNNAAIYPGAFDPCDGEDWDCDGDLVDGYANFDGDLEPDCFDSDDDNDSDPDSTDCDDFDASICTGCTEFCDDIDSDCDGSLVDAFPNYDGDLAPDCVDLDIDGDSFPNDVDCDDYEETTYPNAPEFCDAVDSDCDGSLADEFPDTDGDDLPDCIETDLDGDGFSPGDGDCDDFDDTIFPGAVEFCDDVDQNCDGSLVDGFPNFDGDAEPDCIDDDDDNDGDPDVTDCADLDASIFSGAAEFCDTIDSDCDGSLVDEAVDNFDGDAGSRLHRRRRRRRSATPTSPTAKTSMRPSSPARRSCATGSTATATASLVDEFADG